MKNIIKHWKTSALGAVALGFGCWAMHVTYVPTNTVYFNACYVWCGPFALIAVGIGLLFAADNDK